MPRSTVLADHAIYPLFLGSASVAIVGGVGHGIAYWQVAPVVFVACAAIVVVLERLRPWSPNWQRDHGDTRTDLAHLLANLTVSHASLGLYALVVPQGGPWPAELPFVVQFVIAALVMDLGLYVVHRLSHRVEFLWRLHAIHHSARRLYWVNGQRRHLLHELVEGAPGIVVLGILGAPPAIIACYLGVLAVHLMLQHGNVRHRAGALRWVFAVAELHRWHHQRRYAATQGNYGALLSCWDRLFGTTLPDLGDGPVEVGLDDAPELPDDFAGQLVWPFRREPSAPLPRP